MVDEPFVPFATERLTVRMFRPDDTDILAAYRDDPDVARMQDWDMPYPRERAVAAIERYVAAGDRLRADSGLQLALDLDGELIGDVAVDLDEAGAVAHLGYSLAVRHQGRGYAQEATNAIVDRLFALHPQVHRIASSADPENLPSIRLLESLGFTPEGSTRQSELIRGEWLDDARFGMLRSERAAWLARPSAPPGDVRLVEVTHTNLRAVLALRTFDWQERLVAPNVRSLADAFVPGVDDDGGRLRPWVRAIEADGELVGFVMMAEPSPTIGVAYLWRLMIDRRHQRRGIGRMVLDLVVEQVRAWGEPAVEVSWVPGFGSPEPFYRRAGFVPTGGLDPDGEVLGRLTLATAPPS